MPSARSPSPEKPPTPSASTSSANTPSSSRRRVLALCGTSLAIGAGGGYVASGGLGADGGCDPSPHAVVPTEWSHPNHDGTNTGRAPARSAPDGRLRERWVAETPEIDFGQPVVANGLVFVPGVPQDNAHTVQSLRCLDLAGGKERWRRTLVSEWSDRFGSVVALGDSVYAVERRDGGGEAAAFAAADGSLRWRRPATSGFSLRSDVPWYDRSLAVSGGLVYVPVVDVHSEDETRVDALDARTGRRCGGFTVAAENLLYPPLVAGDRAYLSTFEGAVVAVDLPSGEEAWRTPLSHHPERIVLAGGSLYTPVFDGRLVAIDPESGEVAWSHETTHLLPGGTDDAGRRYARPSFEFGAATAEALVLEKDVFSEHPSSVAALDPDGGEVLWEVVPGERGERVAISRPSVAGESAFVATNDFEADRWRLLRLDVATGEQTDAVDLAGPASNAPVIAGGCVVVATELGLQAFVGG